ncbi:hypothetical protein AJ87_11075 [Rhizobium yanglingense]|nr:hypothetical protein AJ87_11075 [Rhizobium yanglingense]
MKPQQRKFVVELKSARRRTTRPGSIWGDTDLKALARDAEAEAPHLFEPNMVSKILSENSELRPDPIPETHFKENAGAGNDKQFSTSSVEPEQTYPLQHGNDPNDDTSERRSPKASTGRRGVSVNHRAGSTGRASRGRATAAQAEVSSDELVALDEENRHLKGLLTKHLHQQNAKLRKMLERFGLV